MLLLGQTSKGTRWQRQPDDGFRFGVADFMVKAHLLDQSTFRAGSLLPPRALEGSEYLPYNAAKVITAVDTIDILALTTYTLQQSIQWTGAQRCYHAETVLFMVLINVLKSIFRTLD